MTPSRRLSAVFVLLSLASCGSTPKSTKPIVSASNRASKLTVKVSGAVTFIFTGVVPLQVVVTDAKNLAPNLRFRSVATATPVAASGHRFVVGVNIIGTEGDGVFQIQPRPTSPQAGVVASVAYFQIFDSKAIPAGGPGRYDFNVKACTVEFRDTATTGRLTCPSLRDSARKIVSLDMTWSPA